MTLENVIDDLISQQAKGAIKFADFKAAIYNIINQQSQQIANNMLNAEKNNFVRDSFRDAYIKFLTGSDIVLSTIREDELILDDNGNLCWDEGAQDYDVFMNDETSGFWIFKYRPTDIPRYVLDTEKYAKRMAYQIAIEGYSIFDANRAAEELTRAKALADQKAQQEALIKAQQEAKETEEAARQEYEGKRDIAKYPEWLPKKQRDKMKISK